MSTELTVPYQDLIKVMMDTNKTPSQIIPVDIDADTLAEYAEITSNAFHSADLALRKLKPFLGQILLIYKKRPALYQERGYKTWEDWMSIGVRDKYGIVRSDAFACIAIAETFSELPAEKMAEMGINTLKTLTNIVRKAGQGQTVEMKNEIANQWVALAEGKTVKELVQLAEDKNIIDKGEVSSLVPLILYVSPDDRTRFDEFKSDEDIKAYITQQVGEYSDGALLRALIEETSTEWKAQIADAARTAAV